MAQKKQQFALDPEMVEIGLWQLAVLDKTIRQVIGNVAELQKRATAAVEPGIFVPVPDEVKQIIAAMNERLAEHDTLASQPVDLLAMAVELLSDARKQALNEAVTAWLKDNTKDSGASLEALLAERAEKAETIVATAKILVQVKLLNAVPEVPSAPKAKASNGGGGGTKGVKVSGAQYYRIVDGQRDDQPESQNSASSLAYYHGTKLGITPANGKRVTIEEFVSWAQKLTPPVDVKSTKPWSITVGNVTVGMDVISATPGPAPKETSTKDETPAAEEEAKA